MSFNLIPADIGYGEANFKAFKDSDTDRYYQASRIPARGLIDFGEIKKNERVGIQLKQNGINFPMLVKSLYAPSSNSTDDSLLFEVFVKPGEGTKERYMLQYYGKNDLPMISLDALLFPQNIVYVTPAQDSRVLMVLEPVDFIFHAQTRYTPV